LLILVKEPGAIQRRDHAGGLPSRVGSGRWRGGWRKLRSLQASQHPADRQGDRKRHKECSQRRKHGSVGTLKPA
jgi:hypothetical protein